MVSEGKDNDVWYYVNHKYVKTISKDGNIYYTDDFYSDMYHKLKAEKMTAVNAYAALGFNTEMLSEARAYCAAARAIQRMEKKAPFVNNIADYDAETSFEEMMTRYANGSLKKEDLYANMATRLIYLEEMYKTVKKKAAQFKADQK